MTLFHFFLMSISIPFRWVMFANFWDQLSKHDMSNVFPSLNNSSHSTILGLAINISHAVHGRIRSGAAGDRSFASSAKVVHWLHGLCLKMDISIKQMPFVHGKMMTSITLLSFQVLFSDNLI
jgi:hypothetical protein